MSHIIIKDFTELEPGGSNYLTWTMDVKIVLTAKGFMNIINEPNPQNPIAQAQKFTTLHFQRHHLHLDLKADLHYGR
jgi:hypothetical protein